METKRIGVLLFMPLATLFYSLLQTGFFNISDIDEALKVSQNYGQLPVFLFLSIIVLIAAIYVLLTSKEES